jgi:hypothetical protein
VHVVDRVGHAVPSPETFSSREAARGWAAVNCADPVAVPSVARIMAVPALSARTSTVAPEVADRLPTDGSLMVQVTGTAGSCAPLASSGTAEYRAAPFTAAVADVGVIASAAGVTVTWTGTDSLPLGAVKVTVIAA